MTRLEFMKELESLLLDIPLDERSEALAYYNGYFDDAGEEQEEEIVKELGSPEKVAAIIKADLNIDSADLESKGFFTERGYQEAITSEFELAKTESSQTNQKQAEQNNQANLNNNNRNDNNDQTDYNSQANFNSQEAYNGQANYNGKDQANSYYANNGSNTYDTRYGSNHNGNRNEWQNSHWEGSNRSDNGYSGSSNYGNHNYTDSGREKDGSGNILRILLIIVTFPIWFPIVVTVLSIAFAVIATLFGLIFGLGVTGVSLIGAGVILFLAGLTELATPFYGLAAMGGGLVVLSIGMLITIVVGFLCKKVVPVMVNGFVNLCRLPFKNRRAMA